jgi:hypothetical protein
LPPIDSVGRTKRSPLERRCQGYSPALHRAEPWRLRFLFMGSPF